MDNPFSILGIDEKGIDINLAVTELEKKLVELTSLNNFYEESFRKRYAAFRSNNFFAVRPSQNDDVREFYRERYILKLPLDKKHFTKDEFFEIIKKAQELEDQAKGLERKAQEIESKARELESKSRDSKIKEEKEKLEKQAKETKNQAQETRNLSKIYNQSIKEQSSSIREERKKIMQLLDAYTLNPNNQHNITRIEDEYVRLKFEKAFMDLLSKSPLNMENHAMFEAALDSHAGYRRLADAYGKVATAEAREDLVAELYVQKRVNNTVGAISETDARKIIGREKKYQEEFVDDLLKSYEQRAQEKSAENQNHQYGWGIILTNPYYLLKDEPIDTPIFKGKITVENIGRFTEESFFRKVKMKNELRDRRRKNTTIKGVGKPILKRLRQPFSMEFDAEGENTKTEAEQPKYMRDYYYKYRATKTLYDEIYKVTKTDSEGRTRTQIVFSPVTEKSLGKDVSVDFLKNVYFSDYMLDLAKQNGGYAGEVFPSKNGGYNIYNYHPNCEEQIGAAILFDRGFKGSGFNRLRGYSPFLKAVK